MAELPADVVEAVERLTRLARNAVDPNEAAAYRERRDSRLEAHGFTARIRTEETRSVLVLYPAKWVVDGTVQFDRIEETSRAEEIPLDGPGAPDDWNEVEEHNREVAAQIADEHGEVHGANARAFADFMSNHYARRVESATSDEVHEFRTEYFRRNAWPTEKQKAVVERSIALVYEAVDESTP